MKKIKECEIVKDLLPSYIDKVTNESSNAFIEQHLNDCEDCRKILKDMGEELTLNKIDENKQINYLKKIKLIQRIKILILIVIMLFIFITFFSFKISSYEVIINENGKVDYIKTFWNWLTVPTSTFERSNISHILVYTKNDVDSDNPKTLSIIFTFDTSKNICISTRYCRSGFTTDEFKKEYEELIKDNSIVSNIKIENNRLIYSLNTFNGKSTEEVKDHIYKVYSSSSIFEY